jgi:predicted metal-dependent hydrolase
VRIEIVRSARRKRTAEARLISNDLVRVSLPGWVRPEDEHEWVQPLVEKVTRRLRSAEVDLTERAAVLARRYRLPVPSAIRWVGNQGSRWGSCTPSTGEVRISDRLADAPRYVLDYVVVHELAHLVHGDHSRAFKELEDRYPRAERARGYLDALSRYSANSV